MGQMKKDDVRENCIMMEIVVDAYDEEERAMGWASYLEDKISFPFAAECIAPDTRSPLIAGERINVSRMIQEANWGQDMYVEISWNNRTFAVPLAQLQPLDTDEDTAEAISDWHYWKARGYLF